jgi:hypothetical protein
VVADSFVTIAPTQPLWPRMPEPREEPEPEPRPEPIGATPPPPRTVSAGGLARVAAPAEVPAPFVEASVEARGAPTPHEQAYEISGGWRRAAFAGSVPPSARGPSGVPGSPWGGSAQPQRARGEEEVAPARDFWLVADAELIVFGATDPRATVTIGGQKIQLRPDGSFSVRMAFPDGKITMPIVAIAEDGEQRRGMVMRYERATGPDEPVES